MLQTSNMAVPLRFPALSIPGVHTVPGIKFKGGRYVTLCCKRPITFEP